MNLNKKYLYLSIFFFLVEVYIGLYVRDNFIRPYFGDYLVVILLYCMARTVWHGAPWKAAIGVLLFSYLIETLQYFNIVELLGLGHSEFARVIIGTSFAWHDMLAYTLGIATVFLAMRSEKYKSSSTTKANTHIADDTVNKIKRNLNLANTKQ